MARLEHPNIARLLHGGLSESLDPYLATEYVDGVPLDDYCERQSLPLAARLRLFLTLCSAVDMAHRYLILHRDIKPGNVLVTREGTLKLVGFGMARDLDTDAPDADAPETMARLTASFASPEQLRGEVLTTASDVFGLGMTLYQLATGCLHLGGGGKSACQSGDNSTAQRVVNRAVVNRPASLPSAAPSLISLRRKGTLRRSRQHYPQGYRQRSHAALPVGGSVGGGHYAPA